MTDDEKGKIIDVKKAIKAGQLVEFNGMKYIPVALILRYVKSEWLYSVELKDLKAKSVTVARIIDIKM